MSLVICIYFNPFILFTFWCVPNIQPNLNSPIGVFPSPSSFSLVTPFFPIYAFTSILYLGNFNIVVLFSFTKTYILFFIFLFLFLYLDFSKYILLFSNGISINFDISCTIVSFNPKITEYNKYSSHIINSFLLFSLSKLWGLPKKVKQKLLKRQ